MTTAKLNREIQTIPKTDEQWQNRRNVNPISQCTMCQAWEHNSNNSAKTKKYSRCAGDHEITQFQSSEPPTCANCGGHSFYYQRFLPPATTHQQPRIAPAPPPATPTCKNNQRDSTQPRKQQQVPSKYHFHDVNFPNAPGRCTFFFFADQHVEHLDNCGPLSWAPPTRLTTSH